MGILTIGRHEQPNTETLRNRSIDGETVEEYLARGGEIQHIPTGKSAYNLQLRPMEGRGTRRAYVDESQQMRSDAGKSLSVARNEAKAEHRRQSKQGPGRPKEPRDDRYFRAKRLIAEGKSEREAARIIGVSRGTLRHWRDTDEDCNNG